MRSGRWCLSTGDDHKISQCSCQGAKLYTPCIPIQVRFPNKRCVCVCVRQLTCRYNDTDILRYDDVDSPWGRYLQLISTPICSQSTDRRFGTASNQSSTRRGRKQWDAMGSTNWNPICFSHQLESLEQTLRWQKKQAFASIPTIFRP